MIDYLGMVREFHEKFNHHTQDLLGIPPQEVIELRDSLINEEAFEFTESTCIIDNETQSLKPDLVLTADALADLLYVTFGAALAYGIPIEEVFKEVHRSNMTKSMEKDEKSIKGKTIKGPNWEPPNIKRILEEESK